MLDEIPINTTINQISRYEPNEEDCIKSTEVGEIRIAVDEHGKEHKFFCDKTNNCTKPEASDGKIYYYDDIGYKDDVIQPSFLSRLKSAFKYNGGKKSRKSKRRIRKTRRLNKKHIKKQ